MDATGVGAFVGMQSLPNLEDSDAVVRAAASMHLAVQPSAGCVGRQRAVFRT